MHVLFYLCPILSFAWLTGMMEGSDRYREQVLPILEDRCFDCHFDGRGRIMSARSYHDVQKYVPVCKYLQKRCYFHVFLHIAPPW